MKGQNKYLLAALVALMVAISVASIVNAADDHSFSFVNNTHKDVYVEAKRSHDPYPHSNLERGFTVPAGGSGDITLDEGEYWIFYWSCNNDNPDVDTPSDIKINLDEDYQLVLEPCDRQSTVMEVRNHTGETISLELSGADTETYTIEPGLNRINVTSGETIFKYDACDPLRDFNGVIDIHPAGITDLLMRSCEYFDSPEFEFGAGNVVNFNIINHASFPIILEVIGPMSDLMEISPGINPVSLVAGNYSFNYYLDYQPVSGLFSVSPNGNGILLLSPEYTIFYDGLLDEDITE